MSVMLTMTVEVMKKRYHYLGGKLKQVEIRMSF